ncbi:MAG: membrane dipeptidase [Prevotellaceae bacterium]|nr:membrane dipeptidase [Prevotellaceae bacterium]
MEFDWKGRLEGVYGTFPEAQSRPVIGITANYNDGNSMLADGYYKKVVAAGGVPLLIPPLDDTDAIINTLDRIDALILSGGGDYNPLFCGEEPSPRLHSINGERDLPELLITRLAYNRQIPMLGICRGIQTLAMALGGTVRQDIADTDGLIKHSQDANRNVPTHSVSVCEDSVLYNIYGTRTLYVNSFHHQAVGEPGERFRVVASSCDGVVEAIESTEMKSIIGVQWHPECIDDGLPLFKWLVAEAADYRAACNMHNRILTLDTHCDTPMFFADDVRFDRRDPKLLVDLHKMTDGRQDSTIMVAYLPQPKKDETFRQNVRFDVNGPKEYADLIFNKIENIVSENSQYLAFARTPGQLWENKHRGQKSIMLGIENGLALEGDIANIKHFADRGVVYITLCHNGDNDICDSARGNNTHNGVSEFGAKVIAEMNRLGMMVDLSHAHEKSFWDALDISATPIVCSHSSCRALCDHPRNLTDSQMKALADKGGVCQITIYHGFLRSDGEATVMDVLAHLDHAVKVMGIDHVGIGTDFDGDGGVRGMASSADFVNFTRMLMAKRYSEQDIQAILGGNFLRVMAEIQKKRK